MLSKADKHRLITQFNAERDETYINYSKLIAVPENLKKIRT